MNASMPSFAEASEGQAARIAGASRNGICSVSRRSGSGSYSTMTSERGSVTRGGLESPDVLRLAARRFQIFFPTLAVRRIGQHEVKLHRRKGIVRKCGMFRAADDVVGVFALAFEQHVGLADGVGFGIDFLPVQVRNDLFLLAVGSLPKGFFGDCQHAAGT